jgi:hypothetical protein
MQNTQEKEGFPKFTIRFTDNSGNKYCTIERNKNPEAVKQEIIDAGFTFISLHIGEN